MIFRIRNSHFDLYYLYSNTNRNDLVKSLYLGYGEPTNNILNYTSPAYKAFPVKYDLQEAKRLAKEVLGDKRYEITYCINSREPLQKGEAELIAYWLKEIGLDVRIMSLEYATLTKMMRKGECDIVRLQRGLANGDPYALLYTFIMPDGSVNKSNSIGYNNSEIVRLMHQVKNITDEKERQKIFLNCNKKLHTFKKSSCINLIKLILE